MVAIRLVEGESCTDEEIKDYCRGEIANYKIPHYVKFVIDYPMTASGKVQKFRLREIAIEDLGLESDASIETA
jgi:fatty-acyl-CoA synthase